MARMIGDIWWRWKLGVLYDKYLWSPTNGWKIYEIYYFELKIPKAGSFWRWWTLLVVVPVCGKYLR